MKKLLAQVSAADVIGLAGTASISYGAWCVYAPAGFIVGGTFMLVGALFAARSRP